jgi:serine/threonine protein phosphatase PrpC
VERLCLAWVITAKIDPFGNFVGPPRIWDQSGEGPGLMMSRSFGDQMGHRVGMTCVPEVKIVTRELNDKVLLVGSDGLWEKFSEAANINYIRKNYKEPNAAEKICKELVSSATNRWNKVDLYN